jgi:acetyl esterase
MTRHFFANPAFRAARAALDVPPATARRLAGPPVRIDGNTFDPHAQLLARAADRNPLAASRAGRPVERRVRFRREAGMAMVRAKDVTTIDLLTPAGVRVRTYDAGPWRDRAVLYLHGGGWVVGDLDTHDGVCRMLARITGAAVVAVDYRLAPEHPFPTGLQDALEAFRWVRERVSPTVAVMGDSAGGNLAAALSLRLRDAGEAGPVAQGLVYPATDLRLVAPSHTTFREGFYLTAADIRWYRDRYLGGYDPTDPAASPLLAPSHAGLPPTAVWTAGFDPLRDEGRAYAEALRSAGVQVRHREEGTQMHGFFGMGLLPGGLQRIARVCRDLRGLLDEAVVG